ncbi:MAG: trypsin-like peptidase domain-containing protein [Bacteroidetes bacterium]|nr:trypsin-like peptidase domain-containing protein [Bacteroidota bacterium]
MNNFSQHIFNQIVAGILIASGFQACSSVTENLGVISLAGKDTYLTSNPPFLDSDRLETISQSVILVNSITYYRVFYFPESKNVSVADLKRRSPEAYATDLKIKNEPSTGTGLVIHNRDSKLAVLTCLHVIMKPDTVYQYYTSKNSDGLPHLRTLALKLSTDLFLPEYPELDRLSILSFDQQLDVAILGQAVTTTTSSQISEFKGKPGNSSKLKLGTLAYHFGYPAAQKQMTTGLITMGRRNSNEFISDAVTNKGYSGGPVFAYRFNSSEPEWIGITRSSPVHYEWVVAPMEDFDESVEVREFSDGKLLIKRQTIQHYGTTNTLSINSILKFISNNQNNLKEKGYYLRFSEEPLKSD